ncbi:RICIN domain-containing protein [Streptomyces durmitorensis]|uniref:RICIN domain-containing protein n=1 Tax=Streptomyces durmitorensis TaxID=319947 RepID=A0ABY4PMG2_9ACTN|nr:RICIN domain-containing protein [Streptomyces durmitorensis]UQT54054.1 RICIN domain-containing protein [Streptomyces durmitorensis]
MSHAESDMSLAARLRGRTEEESDQPVALLLARHWQSAHDYSAICLATWASSASMVAAASFHQVLGHMARGEPGGALRPLLLVTVRETVRGWCVDDRISALMPELRKPTGGRGMRAATSMTPTKRQLAARSFWALPGVAQCLLWHTAVEAEHISIPAGLSGLSADLAVDALEQAREQFRAGIVRAHRELAPTKECPLYNRLLDVTIRRGGALLPDVQHHLSECGHCRDVSDQLGLVESGLDTLLAEAVLGWGARRYLESRPGRGRPATRGGAAAGRGGRHSGSGGRHRPPSRIPLPGGALGPARTYSKALRTGAVLGSAALLATVLVAILSSGDGGSGGSVPPTDMAGSRETHPSADPEAPPAGSPPPTSAGYPDRSDQGRLRNVAAELCLDIRGGKARPGAETKLAECSDEADQQWSYAKNGLLSSVARPDLCLDSHANDGVVTLGRCVAPSDARADEVRYDLTVLGELLPRWHEGLAVTPASSRKGADVVVKVRDGSADQRWMLDTSTTSPSPDTRSIDGRSGPSVKAGPDRPHADGEVCAGPTCEPALPGEQRPGPRGDGKKGDGKKNVGEKNDGKKNDGEKGNGRRPSPDSTGHGDVHKRYAEVGCCDGSEPVPPDRPGDRLRSPAVRGGDLDGVPSREALTAREMPAAEPGRERGGVGLAP